MPALGKLLLIAGVVLVVLGAVLLLGPRLPGVSHLGKLPGDIRIVRPGFALYLPLTTSILVSLVLTIVLRIFFKR